MLNNFEDEYEDEEDYTDPGYGDEDDCDFYGISLYFIRGLPGAGKTSFAKQLSENLEIEYFEADQYFRYYNDGIFDRSLLNDAHSFCYQSAEDELMEERSVIVSNTSSGEREVSEYKELADRTNARFVSIILETRHSGETNKEIPYEVVENMSKRFSIKL